MAQPLSEMIKAPAYKRIRVLNSVQIGIMPLTTIAPGENGVEGVEGMTHGVIASTKKGARVLIPWANILSVELA